MQKSLDSSESRRIFASRKTTSTNHKQNLQHYGRSHRTRNLKNNH